MSRLSVRAPLAWLSPGRLVDDAVVIMDGGRVIHAGADEGGAPDGGEELVLEGFLMPGVVDRHVHIALSDPGAVLAGGVTAVRDMGWAPEEVWPLADASESPSFKGPLIRAVGPILTCPGGYPSRSGWAPPGVALEVRGHGEASDAVRNVLERSDAAVVKVALNCEAGPTLSDEELIAICDAAHEANATVSAHAQGADQAERAAGAGVDEFAHCPWSDAIAEDVLGSMARRMRIVSTLDIHWRGEETPAFRMAVRNMAGFLQAGGEVVYGTDLGNGPIPPGIHVREAWHLRRAGMSPEQVLAAMTFRPIAPGEPADLIALGANPLDDLNALTDLRLVVRGGRVVRS